MARAVQAQSAAPNGEETQTSKGTGTATSQLQERISQLTQQVAGLTEQRDAKHNEIELIGTELEGVRKLWKQKLVSMDRMTSLEREAIRLEGEHGQLTASIAQAKGQANEVELQIIQIDQDMRSEVATELRDAQAKIAELVERQVTAEDALKHVELRIPQDGVVHELSAHTVGGVIAPAELVMLIVPGLRQADGGGSGRTARHRSGGHRAKREFAHLSVQPPNHPGSEWRGPAGRSRPHSRSTNRGELLRRSPGAAGRGNCQTQGC